MTLTLDTLTDRLLATLPRDVLLRISNDPTGAMWTDFGLTVREMTTLPDRRGAGGWCDGLSFLDAGVVLIVPTPDSRRENFTCAHELAHHLIENNDDILDWIANQPDPDRTLEAICDRVAARLLLPPDLVARVLGDKPPRAEHIAELFHASGVASEPVCAIAIASRLPCQGATVIVDIGGETVRYASVQAPEHEGWPEAAPWPGDAIPAGHALRRMTIGQRRQERSSWTNRWGQRQDYYLDAVAHRRRIHAVVAAYDLWAVERFHGGDGPQTQKRAERLVSCACGHAGVVRTFPCNTCKEPFCPKCDRCLCARQQERLVDCPNPSCFMKVLPHLVNDGRCVNCE